MRKYFIVLASLAVAGCMVSEISEETVYVNIDYPTYSAAFDDESTKVYVDTDLKMHWNAGDEISIFRTTGNQRYSFDGADGDREGTFTVQGDPQGGSELQTAYAVYPYSDNTSINTDGVITLNLPEVQHYAENSFGLGANTMVAVTESKESDKLYFKNLCGYLVVKLYGEGTIKSITLTGNNGEKLSGQATVAPVYGEAPVLTMSESAGTSITLDCGEGVALGTTAENATAFWFAVPPVSFTNGFTVMTVGSSGYLTKSTSVSRIVVRNEIKSLVPIDLNSFESMVPPDDEIWYTTIDETIATIGPPNFIGNVDAEHFNVNVLSNTYENGRGVIKFDGPLTLIQGSIFQNDDEGRPTGRKITSLVLPETVETIWDAAFYGLGITEFRVPSHLQRMGRAALEGQYISRVYGEHTSSDEKCIVIDGTLYYFAPYQMEGYTLPSEVKVINEAVFMYAHLNTVVLNEGLEEIRDDAFSGSHFQRVDLPQSLETLHSWAFRGCFELEGFYGNPLFHSEDHLCLYTNEYYPYWEKTLGMFVGRDVESYSIPEGVTFIQAHAFEGLPNLRSVTFPNSLTDCSFEVFYDCPNLERIDGKFTAEDKRSIVVGDTYVSFAARHDCKEVRIPNHVTKIRTEAFREAREVEVITMGDNVVEIEGYAFFCCSNLKSITFSASLQLFNGQGIFAADDNIESIYFRSPFPPSLNDEDWGYSSMNHLTVYVPRASLQLYLNDSGLHQFRDKMVPYDYTDLPEMDYYFSSDYSQDGVVSILQEASVGTGINIILMGDGFSDRQIADGTYANVMNKAMNAFFSAEPYESYRNHYNVYSVNVVSATEGYEHGGRRLETSFGSGTYVSGNDSRVIEYAKNAIPEEALDDALIIVLMNEDAFAGTCFLYDCWSGDYGRGLSIAYFPTNSDSETFKNMLLHEAGGHGFAKLGDEYAYEYMGDIPQQNVAQARDKEPYGWWKNVDFIGDPTQVKWAQFIADPRYTAENIGCYEGAFTYWTGAWRPTENSIMNNNTGGFNAPSRYAIWYRINKLAYGDSWNGTYEDFVEYDAVNRTPAAVARRNARRNCVEKNLPPLAPPVVVGHSWRDAK